MAAVLIGLSLAGCASDQIGASDTLPQTAPVVPLEGSVSAVPGSAAVTAESPVVPAATPTTTAAAATQAPSTVARPTAALPQLQVAAYEVFDLDSGSVLAASNADQELAVGSIMKLLTAKVILETGDLAHVVTVPDEPAGPDESIIGLRAGEQWPRDLLLRAMLIVSANDAARALAIDLAGSEAGFAKLMNDEAAAMGLAQTHAANPVGLDAAGQHSTAADVVRLGAALMTDETFRAAVAKPQAVLHDTTFPSTNSLLGTYDGANGIKTGRTTQAGYCILASATRGGRTVIVAVLGASSDQGRDDGAAALLDWAFSA
jgi:D-alanyl-D-alanine carboxypeptidase (penicillin-binding protein 5/6)